MTWVISPTLSKSQRKTDFMGSAKSLADVKPKSGQPLDYSFRELTSLSEILSEEPNSGRPKTADVSAAERARTELNSVSLRVSNNMLTSLASLPEALGHVLDKPEELAWLDASFNKLTSIDDVVLSYPNLSVLYLHANAIENIREVRKLSKLPRLTKLTLHGNPLEEANQATYRLQVLAYLPTLRTLDFISCTKVDRDRARVWQEAKQNRRRQSGQ
mmetsp:Transcript_32827/g.93160  ORF Transcript_32827/g.93160 Transcript_32827/m.93160 type:complete len:216 (+) Transcript_32827:285-932(+)